VRGDALGLIEVVGLAAAVEAADAAVKTANVELLELEPSGQGMVTVKIAGNVGAVTAAVQAACDAGGRLSKVYASKVIARPDSAVVQGFLP
jgi:microcompartment protein CcmL/EutN